MKTRISHRTCLSSIELFRSFAAVQPRIELHFSEDRAVISFARCPPSPPAPTGSSIFASDVEVERRKACRCASNGIDSTERGHLEKGGARPPPLSRFEIPAPPDWRVFARIFRPFIYRRERGAGGAVTFWRFATRTITVATPRHRNNNMIIAVTWCGNPRGLAGGGRSRGRRRRGPIARASSLPPVNERDAVRTGRSPRRALE